VYYVYVLLSLKDKQIYTGLSSNLKQRIEEHQKGQVKSTSSRKPLKLIYYEAYLSESDARRRELYLKNGGKAKLALKQQITDSLIGP
jgi:putative endonuclease